MMKYRFIYLLLLYFNLGFSQTPFPDNGKLFQDTIIPKIEIIINPDSLQEILKYENKWSDHEFKADFIFKDNSGNDTIKEVGFRLRGNTSRKSKKKSFKISFNTFKKGRKFYGVEKLNLNGEHNDPSIVRSKFCTDLADQMGIIAPRANHVMLYINGDYYGLYINVEHIDEEFVKLRYGNNGGNLYKCLYPADLNYWGNKGDYYKKEANGRRIYDLKTNKDVDDYSDLALFIKVLNTTSDKDFMCEMEKIFDVDSYLKVMAFDILTANWDGYIFNKNNFYLYHDQKTGKFKYIIYDLDNTFGIDWFGIDWAKRNIYEWSRDSQKRPLYKRILDQKIYRSRFTSYMKEIIDSIYQTQKLNEYLDKKKDLISEAALMDQYRTLDYGFTFQDFLDSYDIAPGYDHVPIGIKQFLSARRFWANEQLEINKLLPDIGSDKIIFDQNNETFQIIVEIDNNQLLSKIELSYRFNNGEFEYLELNDLGQNGDVIMNDGIYSSPSISSAGNKYLHYYLSITDKKDFEFNEPACDYKAFYFPESGLDLAINEFMASNDNTIQDEAGEYDDWLELYNYGSDTIFLGDKYLTDNQNNKTKWKMPEQWLLPNEFILFWADKDEEQGENHCNFKLSADGEYIGIFNSGSTGYEMIDEISFDKQKKDVSMGRYPDGTGEFGFMDPTPGFSNNILSEKDILTDTDFKIIPNPANTVLTLSFSDHISDKSIINIIDINGNILKNIINDQSKSISVDVSKLPAGTYFIRVINKKNISISSFIKI